MSIFHLEKSIQWSLIHFSELLLSFIYIFTEEHIAPFKAQKPRTTICSVLRAPFNASHLWLRIF